jgi:hypothetical protein
MLHQYCVRRPGRAGTMRQCLGELYGTRQVMGSACQLSPRQRGIIRGCADPASRSDLAAVTAANPSF